MKQVILAGAIAVVIITGLLMGIYPMDVAETASTEPTTMADQPKKNMDSPETVELEPPAVSVEQPREIPLDATVSITMDVPEVDNPTQARMRKGLGTLVRHEGEILVITHDHWGELLDIMAFGRLWSTDGEMLLEADGATFREMIIHRDSGTMILKVPQGVISEEQPIYDSQIILGYESEVQVGDRVLAVVRDPNAFHQVEIQEAVVESVEDQLGLPSLTLRRLNGNVIEPGDSGGGVWKDGKLVGNLWYRVMHRVVSKDDGGEAVETLRPSDLNVAARPPLKTV
jgi:hypothetical protein